MNAPKAHKVPEAGKGTSIRVDQQLHEDLATLMRCGMNATDAVKHAVSIVAGAYRNAWATPEFPDGKLPTIHTFMMSPPPATETAEEQAA